MNHKQISKEPARQQRYQNQINKLSQGGGAESAPLQVSQRLKALVNIV